jgi:hypothetical protein
MEVADQVLKAAPDDLPQISTALGRAFFDDPLFAWALPDADRRQRLLPEFFALFTNGFLRRHQTYTTAGDIVAAGLWAPPGAVPVAGEDAEELGRRITELAGPRRAPLPGGQQAVRRPPPARVLLVPAVPRGRPGLAGPGHRLGLDGPGAAAL